MIQVVCSCCVAGIMKSVRWLLQFVGWCWCWPTRALVRRSMLCMAGRRWPTWNADEHGISRFGPKGRVNSPSDSEKGRGKFRSATPLDALHPPPPPLLAHRPPHPPIPLAHRARQRQAIHDQWSPPSPPPLLRHIYALYIRCCILATQLSHSHGYS